MDKLKMHSLDGVERNIEMIGKMFPNTITEVKRNGKVEHAIDFDVLRQELSKTIVEGREERYQFTWPDKKKAMLAANAPISATLRPIKQDSVGKDGTPGGFDSENLYIEGDNLEVLKLLQETYLGKVKMIYIDPPYNTGNDFVYEDDFAQDAADYMENSGQYDEEGNRLVTNTESNGRFHTDWLNMIYPRLKLAKDLLSEDGVIFISADDNEQGNLKKCCDEVFGESNFVTQFIWTKTETPPSLSNKCRKTVEYLLCYEKNINNNRYFGSLLSGCDAPLLNTGNSENELIFPANCVKFNFIDNGTVISGAYDKVVLLDDIDVLDGKNQNPFRMKAEFKWGQSKLDDEVANGTYFICKTDNLSIRFQRQFDATGFKAPNNFLNTELNKIVGVATNENADSELEALGLAKVFSFPKPVSLIKYLVNMVAKFDKSAVIFDFFSGSATTAHAVMQLNAEDKGGRRFILVQVPEEINPEKANSEKARKVAQNAVTLLDSIHAPHNICEIGKERIRRAGRKIKEDAGLAVSADLDIGFRCLRLDDSNMENVYYAPDDVKQESLFAQVENVKPDRTPEDLLFQVMLDLGVLLSSPIKEKEIVGKNVFDVADGSLLACFDQDVTDETVKAIAQKKPTYAVFRDNSMTNDSVATNFDQIFETYSPDTVRKVL